MLRESRRQVQRMGWEETQWRKIMNKRFEEGGTSQWDREA